jgi:hypothetical protein
MKPHKKGFMNSLNILPTVAILLVVTGIIFALGLQVLSDTGDDALENWCDDSGYYYNSSDGYCWYNNSDSSIVSSGLPYEVNATNSALEGVGEVPSKFPTIGVAIAAVVVISIVAGAFMYARGRR